MLLSSRREGSDSGASFLCVHNSPTLSLRLHVEATHYNGKYNYDLSSTPLRFSLGGNYYFYFLYFAQFYVEKEP
jgi:hypothetical protein